MMTCKSGANKSDRLRRLPEFQCLFPETIEEALSFLDLYNGSCRIIAGGTDLLNKMKRRRITPRHLVDLKRIPDLDFIGNNAEGKPGLTIGATATLNQIYESPMVRELNPILMDAVSVMASPQIRNTASMVGNLCNAVPSADSAAPLITLQAKLKAVGPKGERSILVEDFFEGPHKTVLFPNEMVTEIMIPPPPPGGCGTYLKHTLRAEGDLAMVGVALYMTINSEKRIFDDAKIALNAVAPTPMRAIKAEASLKGKPMDMDLIENAARIASEEAKPIDDIRSSAEYRREIVRVLTKRGITQLLNIA